MNFEQLEIIISLAQERQFSRAAKKLHITTSAVSQAVSNLEKELGLQLFQRTRNSTVPTIDGQYVIREAHIILEKQKEIYKYKAGKDLPSFKVKMGTIPGITDSLIEVIYALKQDFPFLQLDLSEYNTPDLLKALKEEKLDFALIGFSDTLNNYHLPFDITKLVDGTFHFAVNRQSPLAKFKVLRYEQVIQQPLALYQDNYLLNYLSQMENKTHCSARILFKTNHISAIAKAVCQDMAIAFGPYYSLFHIFFEDLQQIKLIPIEQDPDMLTTSCLWFISSRDASLTSFSKTLLTLIRQKLLLYR
ncbi:LysR family transcriptional regulator [Sporolactobacillus sp. CQH2019]|uniref:LysR family transcriptional regulator n=1 Tax=Sporolactobacillus sp. CQH2019 TaxID=3023512 RepID=UPI0023681980|nr:LysR family transcriptional regulator [Sporolactobacillus sp. CQH2019]MDD9150136.1 LysR family transcriptional regulator [Sporolactobacillus sp. CQH2019]